MLFLPLTNPCYVKRVVELLLAPLAVGVHLKQRVDHEHGGALAHCVKTRDCNEKCGGCVA